MKWKKWRSFFGIIKILIKKYYHNKVLNFALEKGEKTWSDVDEKFDGPLDKSKYQNEIGGWLDSDSETLYEEEKWARRRMWTTMLKTILKVAYPQYSGYLALLDIVLGRLGMEKRTD